MKASLIAGALLLVSTSVFAVSLKPGTYSSPDCTVKVFEAHGNMVIDLDAPGSQIPADQVVLNKKLQSENGPSLCTDSETVGVKAAQSVYATFEGNEMTVSCGGLLAPIKASLVVSLADDGSVTSLTETNAVAAISFGSGISLGPVKTRKSVSCSNLIAQ